MTDAPVKIETSGSVITIALNRPQARNALNDAAIAALTDAYRQASANDVVRVVVLRGEGPVFCAGADIGWMRRSATLSHDENLADARAAAAMFESIAVCPKVTIARVHGAAMGGGVGAMAACDIAIAADDAVFAFSEVRLGIAPAVVSPYIVARTGVASARALFVTGRKFDAVEALRIKLVDDVTSGEALDDAVQRHIDLALGAGPKAIAATKALLRKLDQVNRAEITGGTIALIADLRVSDEGQEGLAAFLEKRKPGYAE